MDAHMASEGTEGLIALLKVKGIVERERTPVGVMLRALFVYVNGASLRRTADQIAEYRVRSYKAVWEWIQKFRPVFKDLFFHQDLPDVLVVDETQMMEHQGRECYVWIAIDPVTKAIVYCGLSTSRSILTALGFLNGIRKHFGKLPKKLITDGGVWYPFACHRLGVEHERVRGGIRNYVERFNETLKDRSRSFDKYHPCPRTRCRFDHVDAFVLLVVAHYNWVRPHMSRAGKPPVDRLKGCAWAKFQGVVRIALS